MKLALALLALFLAVGINAQVIELADTFTNSPAHHRTTTGNYLWTAETYAYWTYDSDEQGFEDYDDINPGYWSVNHVISTNSYTLSVDVSYPTNSDFVSAQVFIRYDRTTGNAYVCEWLPKSSSVGIFKMQNHVSTTLGAPYVSVSGLSHTLKLQANGTTINAWCDGNLIASVTDPSISGAGYVGVGSGIEGLLTGSHRNNHMLYKNVQVTKP